MPKGWEWARMSSLSSVIHYGFTASARLSGNAKLLRITDIQDGKVQWDDVPFCEIDKKGLCNYQLENDDIVIARTGGTVGKSFVISDISVVAVFASYLIRIKPVPGIYIPYIATYLESPCYWRQLTDATSGTGQPNVNGQSLSNLLVPIPPFDEQKRIIVERNSIYPLLQKYTTAQDRLDALNESLRGSIKKSVLQEAIQGRLVPQDPKEKPASVLLEQICEEKRKLLKEGKLKKKDLVDSTIIKGEDNKYYEKVDGRSIEISEELPFDIPSSWAWCRLGFVIVLQSGQDLIPEKYFSLPKGIPYITGASNFSNSTVIVNRWTNSPTSISHKGDLLITCKGTVGTMAYNTIGDIHIARQIMSIHSDWILIDYIEKYLEFSIPTLEKSAHSIIPGISRETILNTLIPIPPLKEQRRIVDRIKEIY